MRICLYTNTALPKLGGQELVVDALARQFQLAGHQVLVLAPRPRRPLRTDDAALPYRVVRHPRFRSARFLVSWYGHFLRSAHRRFPFDVVHCHGIDPPGYLAGLNRRRLGTPVVITSHGGDVYDGCVRLAKAAVGLRCAAALRSADALIAMSRFTAEGYRRLCADAAPIVAIPNGVDLRPFSAPAARPAALEQGIEASDYFLFLGRVARRKGIDTLLTAQARIPPQERKPLVIAGDGKDRTELRSLSAQLGLTGQVHFVGAVRGSDKIWLLQNAIATVMPSRQWEAFPLVVLESYAAGTPVIGTKIPGLADLVDEDQTGALVPAESPEALAAMLRQVVAQRAVARRWGEHARRVAADFDWPIVARRHLELYDRLRSGQPAVSPIAADRAA